MQLKFLFSRGTSGHIKTVVPMKFLLLIFAFCFILSTNSKAQTITFSVNNISLEKAFKEIQKQSKYSFVYTREQINKSIPVSVEVKGASLKAALDILFTNQPLTYIIDNRHVIVKDKLEKQTSPLVNSSTGTNTIDITGKVVDENGRSLEGASVIAKNSKKGVSTNRNGEFELRGLLEKDRLLITNVGFSSKEIGINQQRHLLITLEFATTSLEETVIKGYYSTTKKLNTGSVTKVRGEEISKQPVSNPISALQGRVPGLLITQKNGLPGSNMIIRIRGQNSIQQGNDPLFLVDGVPFSPENLDKASGALNVTSPFNTINPASIESIEILKDADATAIYGSRGANGVVLITTKKAKPGKILVNVDFKTGWGKITRTMDFLTTEEYLIMRHEAFKNDGVIPTAANAPDLFSWDTTRYTNWKKELIGNTACVTNLHAGISGGTKSISYSFNSGYYNEGNVFPGDFRYKRGSVGLSLSSVSDNNKFSAVFSSQYTADDNNLPNQDLTAFINAPPNMYRPFDANGNLQWNEGGYSYGNPFSLLREKYNATSERLISNISLKFSITPNVSIKSDFNYNTVHYDQYKQRPISSQDPSYNPQGTAGFNYTSSKTWNVEPQLNYDTKLFLKGTFKLLIGSAFQQKRDEGVYLLGRGYTNDAQITSIAGAASVSIQDNNTLYRFSSVYGRLNYNWSEKYLFNMVARQDASSRFGSTNRAANFAAIGGAWIFSSERLIRDVAPWLTFGKLRLSYGTTGNDQIGDYQYLDAWSNTTYSYHGDPGLQPLRLYNDRYGWEQIRKIDAGLDLSFLKNRIAINIDFFRHRSIDQLISYSLPNQTGFTSIIRNIPAVIQNKGVEISTNSINIKNESFSWTSSFNITIQRNKLLEFSGLDSSNYAGRYMVGKPVNGLLIGYTYLGVNIETGIYKFEDKNKDGVLNNLDYSFQGATDPTFFGGLENTLQYKQLQLSFLFEFRKQNGRHAIFGGYTLPGEFTNQPTAILNRWQKPGDIASYQQFTQAYGRPAARANSLKANSSAALTNASFARLKTVALYYTLPINLIEKIGAESCQLYLQGQNLLTITNYMGADPENQNLQTLPPLKVLSVGFNINF